MPQFVDPSLKSAESIQMQLAVYFPLKYVEKNSNIQNALTK